MGGARGSRGGAGQVLCVAARSSSALPAKLQPEERAGHEVVASRGSHGELFLSQRAQARSSRALLFSGSLGAAKCREIVTWK